jgi:hypothetical protein
LPDFSLEQWVRPDGVLAEHQYKDQYRKKIKVTGVDGMNAFHGPASFLGV